MDILFHHHEFECEVRDTLGIPSDPITEEDVLRVTELDLSNFNFLQEDRETLALFKNLTSLDINIGYTPSEYWHNFPKLKHFYLCYWGGNVDFVSFQKMTDLEMLWVSGGDCSSIDYLNLDTLVDLAHLHYLELHEFGTVDLLPLSEMPQLKSFALRYANKVENIEIIGSMRQLEELVLDGLYVDTLDFLDLLPDTVQLEMCGNHVYGSVDATKWKRFSKHDICEISVGSHPHGPFGYIDLSVLDSHD
jgi:hypothetical protein